MEQEQATPGSTWVAKLRGRLVKVLVLSRVETHEGVLYHLRDETNRAPLASPLGRGSLLEPWAGSLTSRTCAGCGRVFTQEPLPHACRGLTREVSSLAGHACADVQEGLEEPPPLVVREGC